MSTSIDPFRTPLHPTPTHTTDIVERRAEPCALRLRRTQHHHARLRRTPGLHAHQAVRAPQHPGPQPGVPPAAELLPHARPRRERPRQHPPLAASPGHPQHGVHHPALRVPRRTPTPGLVPQQRTDRPPLLIAQITRVRHRSQIDDNRAELMSGSYTEPDRAAASRPRNTARSLTVRSPGRARNASATSSATPAGTAASTAAAAAGPSGSSSLVARISTRSRSACPAPGTAGAAPAWVRRASRIRTPPTVTAVAGTATNRTVCAHGERSVADGHGPTLPIERLLPAGGALT